MYPIDEAFLQELQASQVKYVVDIGTDLNDSRLTAANAQKYDFVYATAGFWPGNTTGVTEDDMAAIGALLQQPKVVAMGEIGLDYHYEDTDKEAQQYWFRKGLELAILLKKPVCIHSRDADDDTMRILKESGIFSQKRYDDFPPREDGSPDARVLLHSFSGSAELARQYVKLGADISISGPVTYKNARKAVQVVAETELSRLTAETDAPYLTPVPFRGTPNKSVYVAYTVQKIAEIKGISFEEAARATLANGCRFFGIENK